MAGGTWVAQNKVRAGAYINFKAISVPTNMIGTRGVATMPLPLSWGDKVIELYSDDLFNGNSIAKVGYSVDAPEMQTIREVLKRCYKLLIYRLDKDGIKATSKVGAITATAKYAGALGNNITVKVVANGTKFDVITLFNSVEKDKQTVVKVEELLPNEYVIFTGTGALTANAGTALTGGTNGTVGTDYTEYLATITSYNWDTMGIPQDVTSQIDTFVTYIKKRREELGLGSQIVLYKADSADYEGVISVSQGYKTNYETISPLTFVATMAGITAGSSIVKSNTFEIIATKDEGGQIVYPEGTLPYDVDKIISELNLGHIVLSTRRDGAVVIEKDINTLHTYSIDRNVAYSKNRVIRVLDGIRNDISTKFEIGYIGKVNNDENGRNIFKADLISYFNNLQSMGAIHDFDSTKDLSVVQGESIDSILANVIIKPTDSMEKLYMTVSVDVTVRA